jgi:hypothetical protein
LKTTRVLSKNLPLDTCYRVSSDVDYTPQPINDNKDYAIYYMFGIGAVAFATLGGAYLILLR